MKKLIYITLLLSLSAAGYSQVENYSTPAGDNDVTNKAYIDGEITSLNDSIAKYDQTYIAWAISDSTTELTTANGDGVNLPFDCYIDSVHIFVNKAPTGSTLTADVKLNGTSIFSTLITIDSGDTTSVGATTPAVLSTTSADFADRLNGYVSSAGATYGGSGLKIYAYIRRRN